MALSDEERKEKARQRARAYYLANKDKEAARNSKWRRENADRVRVRQREYGRRRNTERREEETERIRTWRHGLTDSDWTAMRTAQEGRCYLCGDELSENRKLVHLDHDHRCCPRMRSCKLCHRGLTCGRCNQLIGLAGDDPDRLRRIAASLEIALKDADARLALRPQQETLL
jgi:hypothetical protein